MQLSAPRSPVGGPIQLEAPGGHTCALADLQAGGPPNTSGHSLRDIPAAKCLARRPADSPALGGGSPEYPRIPLM